MSVRKYLAIGTTFILMLATTLVCVRTNRFTNPSSVKMSDLKGVWVANYATGTTDSLTLYEDGCFRQVYVNSNQSYIFDSRWNQWDFQQMSSGEVRVHLYGGRYYLAGISIAENNGRKDLKDPCLGTDCTWGLEPFLFYDPFSEELVEMVDELLLIVQVNVNGELILHHLWTTSDRGFVIGDTSEIFTRKP